MMRTTGLPLVLNIALAGCALQTAPSQIEILDQALPAETRIPTEWMEGVNNGPVADGWLRSFNDPVLEALVAEAISNNLDLRQAAASVEVARQTIAVVGAQLLPHIGGQLGAKRTYDFGNEDDVKHSFSHTLGALSMSWELDVWGRLRAERDAAAANFDASALDYDYARQSLAATVALNWYLTTETWQIVMLAERAVGVYGRLLDLAEIRFESGKSSELDVADAKAREASARGDLDAARIAYGRAVRSLEVMLGRYPAAELATTALFPPVPPTVAADVPAALLNRRPDILAAEYQVLAAFRREEAARLALLPDFSLALTAERLGDHLLEQLHLSQNRASAQLGAVIPIYEGGALCAFVQIANAQQAKAVANYGSVVLDAFREVEDVLESEALLANRLIYAQRSLADRTRTVEIATEQYKAGRRDLLWVETLQTDKLAAEANVIKLRNAQIANRIRLHLALGGRFESEPSLTGPGSAK